MDHVSVVVDDLEAAICGPEGFIVALAEQLS
jgi:hypothetical protein